MTVEEEIVVQTVERPLTMRVEMSEGGCVLRTDAWMPISLHQRVLNEENIRLVVLRSSHECPGSHIEA